jgi:hypothetical protein
MTLMCLMAGLEMGLRLIDEMVAHAEIQGTGTFALGRLLA